MATAQELRGHRHRCVRDGVTATVGGVLLAVLPLSAVIDELTGVPAASEAFATLAAVAGLLGTVALTARYRAGFGVPGWLGSVAVVVGFLMLVVGGATGSLDLLGRVRPGGGLLAVGGYFLVLVGSVPFGFALWRSGGSSGAALLFVLAMPVGYVLGLGFQRFVIPDVTAAFAGFGLPVAVGFIVAGVSVFLEPAPE